MAKSTTTIRGINPEAVTWGEDPYDHPLCPACSQVLPVKPQGVWARGVESWARSRDQVLEFGAPYIRVVMVSIIRVVWTKWGHHQNLRILHKHHFRHHTLRRWCAGWLLPWWQMELSSPQWHLVHRGHRNNKWGKSLTHWGMHRQYGSHFADNIYKLIFLSENCCIVIQICSEGSNWQ